MSACGMWALNSSISAVLCPVGQWMCHTCIMGIIILTAAFCGSYKTSVWLMHHMLRRQTQRWVRLRLSVDDCMDCEYNICHFSLGFFFILIRSVFSCAAVMETGSRVIVQVLLLALVLQLTLSQHWSYGWLPGGKRSVGELEATIRVRVIGFCVCLF